MLYRKMIRVIYSLVLIFTHFYDLTLSFFLPLNLKQLLSQINKGLCPTSESHTEDPLSLFTTTIVCIVREGISTRCSPGSRLF